MDGRKDWRGMLTVAGVKTRPDLQPPSLIMERVRSMWFDASGWKVMYDAPVAV
jgi:hypothetical protein